MEDVLSEKKNNKLEGNFQEKSFCSKSISKVDERYRLYYL